MRIPQVLVPLLSLLATACISLPDIEPGPPSGDGGSSADAGSDGGSSSDGGVDQTAPTIARTTPPNSATRVPLDSTVEIDFSEEMITSTLRLSSTPPISFSLSSWTPETHRAVFSASSPFAQDTAYTVSVEGQDLAGNALAGTHGFTFTTVGPAPDTTPPTLVDSSPSDGAIGAPRQGLLIKLTFSEPMHKASVESAFSISSPTNSSVGSFSWNPEGTEAVFDPSTDFPYGTTVQWSLTNGATDLAGNLLSSTSRTFRVVREDTAVLSREQSNEGLIYDINTSSTYATWPIGDDSQNKTFRAGTSFMLSALNSQLTRITGATLSWPYINSCGSNCSPFSRLGAFVVEPVYYGDSFIPQEVWNTPRIGTPLLLDNETALGIESGYCHVPVLSMAVDAWNNRAIHLMRVQFRLRFENLTNNDSSADNLEIWKQDLNLVITYEYP